MIHAVALLILAGLAWAVKSIVSHIFVATFARIVRRWSRKSKPEEETK